MRDRSHWNFANLRPRDPVLLGLCTQSDLNAVVLRARKALEKNAAAKEEAAAPTEPAKPDDSQRRATLADLAKFLPDQSS